MKVLLAVDGSPGSDLAVREVARRPWPTDTVVCVVTVDPPVEPALFAGASTVFDEIVQRQREETVQRMNAAVATLRQEGPGLTVVPKLLDGTAKEAIVGEAEKWGADLIVLGSHGYGPVRRFFLGSVSMYVAQNAPCSVLIARGRPEGDTPPGAGPVG